ncbi:quinone oxidoreductase isoform X2 [Cherax quadricarinatus]|uniref:quinone oxidoreductase isoform X2 n=1 Tax=Cherax quadricarinatus TaxID=27406 RepID=UPI002378FDF6|nr:quinone oxidoreductase-like isoform X1 [Cherax quadricarinatus]XP_053646865.1 quinone oxidoreductase-like isoform X1 [Cherax quadricarinatus]XP_053646866.1 quinone oxidoreductase-like isoform X1 [Cherax quadricarinatus]XP_053646867.1 quinone oxidoreductase-like isoform X1 [Cherax quadricarinatus]XP_053646868.1 quinone oxidoreductase-like isoform X1 [Cherax quadricarinatus]XP_053646870.1 quinone oxidoreductase-like isoform X1 [Cherax quadricarinatus]XP_053646871.1 quinone oxidoreductase-lik
MSSVRANMMRGVIVRQFGGVEQMKIENDFPVPSVGDKQVLIKVHTSGVNPVDTYIRGGQYAKLPELPHIPGRDAAGMVHSIGSRVTKFKPGDRVFSSYNSQFGTLAEFTCADESRVFPLDEKLTFLQGAGLGIPYFTAYRALFQKAHAKKGERVLVHGASGAVGLAAVQIGKAHGMYVAGTAGTQEGLDLVTQFGADEVFNHRDKNYISQIQSGEKFDVILEMLANVNLGKDLTLVKPQGRTIVIGSRGTVSVDPRNLMITESSVIGMALATAPPDEWDELTAGVVKGVKAGWVKPVVDKVYTLEEAGKAHYDIINSKGAKGNLVVKLQD